LPIAREQGPDSDTTVFRVIGGVDAEEIVTQIVHFLVDAPTPLVIWDVRDGSQQKQDKDG
jgi:hypothetical protein